MQPNDRESIVGQARADLAAQLGLDTDEIEVLSVEECEFPDTSLGVPEPGQMYAQMLTPGYVVRLGAEGRSYVYRGSGERVVRVTDG